MTIFVTDMFTHTCINVFFRASSLGSGGPRGGEVLHLPVSGIRNICLHVPPPSPSPESGVKYKMYSRSR